jgi:hypothetical protein
MATTNTQKRSGFLGHKNYGAYAGDYVATIKDLTKVGRSSAGTQNFNKLQRYQAQQKMKTAIDSGNVNFDMGLVPDKYKAQVKEYILEKAREKGQLELQIERMREGGNMQDPMYQELRMQAAAIAQELGPEGSLTTQFTKLNQGAAEYAEDSLEGAISIMSNSENLYANSALYANELDLQINNGMLSFGNDELGFSALKDFPEYFNADYTNASKIISQSEGLYDKGEKLSEPDKLLLSNNFQEILRKGGVESVLSLAFDSLITPNESFLDYNDPKYQRLVELVQGDDATMAGEAMEILKKDLTDSYLELMNNQANAGYNKKNPANPNSPNSSDMFDGELSFWSGGKWDNTKFTENLEANMKNLKAQINNILEFNSSYATPLYNNISVGPGNPPMIGFNNKDGTRFTLPLDKFIKLANKRIK